MNLITFDKTEKRPIVKNSKPFITVNRKGKFNFSQEARRLIQFTEGNRVILHQDAVYRSDWYLEITSENRGYKIVFGKADTRFTSHTVAPEIFKSIGRNDRKMSFPIALKPYQESGRIYWIIETKKPL